MLAKFQKSGKNCKDCTLYEAFSSQASTSWTCCFLSLRLAETADSVGAILGQELMTEISASRCRCCHLEQINREASEKMKTRGNQTRNWVKFLEFFFEDFSFNKSRSLKAFESIWKSTFFLSLTCFRPHCAPEPGFAGFTALEGKTSRIRCSSEKLCVAIWSDAMCRSDARWISQNEDFLSKCKMLCLCWKNAEVGTLCHLCFRCLKQRWNLAEHKAQRLELSQEVSSLQTCCRMPSGCLNRLIETKNTCFGGFLTFIRGSYIIVEKLTISDRISSSTAIQLELFQRTTSSSTSNLGLQK